MIHRPWGTPQSPRLRALWALILASCLEAAAAAEPTYEFDLPVQPLATTLDSLANTAGLKLLYSDDTVQGRQSPALRGRLTTSSDPSTFTALRWM